MQDAFEADCRGNTYCRLAFDVYGVDLEAMKHFLDRAYASESATFSQTLDFTRLSNTNIPGLNFDRRARTWEYDPAVPEPIMYVFAACDNQALEVPYLNTVLDKADFLRVFITMDIIIFFIVIVGVNIIGHG